MSSIPSLRKEGYFVSLKNDLARRLVIVECNIYIQDYDDETGATELLVIDDTDGPCQACKGAPCTSSRRMSCPGCGNAMNAWSLTKRTYKATFKINEAPTFMKPLADNPMPPDLISIISEAIGESIKAD